MEPSSFLVHLLLVVSLVMPLGTGRIAAPGAPPDLEHSAVTDDLFSQIYKRSVVKQRSLRSIRARFTETTVSSLLVKPITAHGTVVAASPARVRMIYTDPEPKTVVMDGQSLTVLWPDRGDRERIDTTAIQKRIDQYFTHASIDDLRGMFDVTAEPDHVIVHADHVDMKPKRKQIKQGLERLELWIDRASEMLVQMRLTFPGGDQKTIAFEDIAINVPITDDTFRIPP
jgi:outer membrane lipoprotein-sorting protein